MLHCSNFHSTSYAINSPFTRISPILLLLYFRHDYIDHVMCKCIYTGLINYAHAFVTCLSSILYTRYANIPCSVLYANSYLNQIVFQSTAPTCINDYHVICIAIQLTGLPNHVTQVDICTCLYAYSIKSGPLLKQNAFKNVFSLHIDLLFDMH